MVYSADWYVTTSTIQHSAQWHLFILVHLTCWATVGDEMTRLVPHEVVSVHRRGVRTDAQPGQCSGNRDGSPRSER